MYVAHRDPRPEWVEACQRVAPPLDRLSHLTLRWVPGLPGRPVQRWVVFECVPRGALEGHPVLELLDPAHDQMHRWAHDYLQRTGCLPIACWYVQGADGGHPAAWTRSEQVLADAGILRPAELPALGALPYAEPDDRVWAALAKRSHLNRTITDAHEARLIARLMAEQQARAADVAETEEVMRDALDGRQSAVMDAARPVDTSDARRVGALVSDEDIARYIETGDLTLTP